MAWADIAATVYTAKIISGLKNILTAVANVQDEFTGSISEYGGKVSMVTGATPSISAYDGTDITIETIAPDDMIIDCDQKKAFGFRIPLVDDKNAFAKIKDDTLDQGLYGLADAADTYIYSLHASAGKDSFADGLSGAGGSTAWTVGTDASGIPDLFAGIKKQARSLNIPLNNLVFHAPATVEEALTIYFAGRDSQQGDSVQKFGAGAIGKFFGVNTVISNSLASATGVTHGFLHPYKQGIGFAQSIVKYKEADPEANFGVNVLGLHVYGAKVIQPAAVLDVNLADTLLA